MSNFKNPFVKPPQKSIPLPRIRGKAKQTPNGGWTWEFDIFVGEEYVATMSHPADKPNFLTKQGAITDMQEKAMDTSKIIGKEAYGLKDEELNDLKYFDNLTNSMVDHL